MIATPLQSIHHSSIPQQPYNSALYFNDHYNPSCRIINTNSTFPWAVAAAPVPWSESWRSSMVSFKALITRPLPLSPAYMYFISCLSTDIFSFRCQVFRRQTRLPNRRRRRRTILVVWYRSGNHQEDWKGRQQRRIRWAADGCLSDRSIFGSSFSCYLLGSFSLYPWPARWQDSLGWGW